MESPHQAGKITSLFLLFAFAAAMGAAAWYYVSSPVLARLAKHDDYPIHLVVTTDNAMRITYNPALRKAVITVSAKKCDETKINSCFSGTPHGYFIPQETDQERFLQDFEYGLSHWRYNPLLLGRLVASYARARWQKRTNLNAAQFWALSLELAKMQINDFTLVYPPQTKNKKNVKKLPEPSVSAETLLTEEEDTSAPLKVGILNASGRKGLAKELTRYLRRQNEKGVLQVDVAEYDNYRTRKEKTEIIDYSGRLMQVSKLSHTIGFKGTPKADTAPNDVYYDTRIILGEDFEMPL